MTKISINKKVASEKFLIRAQRPLNNSDNMIKEPILGYTSKINWKT